MKIVKRYKVKNIKNWKEFIVLQSVLSFYKNMKWIEVIWEVWDIKLSNYSGSMNSSSTKSLVLDSESVKQAEVLISSKEVEVVKEKEVSTTISEVKAPEFVKESKVVIENSVPKELPTIKNLEKKKEVVKKEKVQKRSFS